MEITRILKNEVRVEKSLERSLEQMKKETVVKIILHYIVSIILALAIMAGAAVAMFNLWNYNNPTQDYLYFIVLYMMFGSFVNVCIFAFFDARMKKIKKRLGMKMRIRERQIARYYRGLLRELNEC